jgi:DNA polymerase-3 subunit alpha
MSKTRDEFAHFHVHGAFSILDGLNTIPQMADKIVELGQPLLSATDHGAMGGLKKLSDECNKRDIKPAAGCEFYVAPGSRFTKSPVRWGKEEQKSEDVSLGAYLHATVVATTDEGVRNLFRLQSIAYSEGRYYKPRIDFESLASHSEGLVVTTGCVGGALGTRIRLGQIEQGMQYASDLKDAFGDHAFIEIMNHDMALDKLVNPVLIDVSRKLNIPLLATNDAHMASESDAYAHDALLCLQTGQKIHGERKFKFDGNGYHLRSRAEMDAALPDVPDAIKNTLLVAEMIQPYSEVFSHKLRMPQAHTDHPDGSGGALIELTQAARGKVSEWTEEYEEREIFELDAIISLGYADYMLVTADLIRFAHERGIRTATRGSAGGSLVAYLTGITNYDPVEHGLIFHRFINPDRASVPDADLDFQDDRRQEVFEYARNKYGVECVAGLGTFGVMGAKSAIHDSARVLGMPRRQSDLLTHKLPPMKFGRAPALSEGDWSDVSESDQTILDLARQLEGCTRSMGQHAAGVIISPEPLKDILPLYKPKDESPVVTEYDMGDVADIGLVKLDFLGSSTLAIIDDCLRTLSKKGVEVTLPTKLSELTDEATFQLLSTGDSLTLFQLDSDGMQMLLRKLKPTHFDDIPALLALWRPGPIAANSHLKYAARKNGKEAVEYPHPELANPLKDVLGPTYGLALFQEQILNILKVVGGYTYGTATGIFDSMRKKQTEKMLASRPEFVQRMTERGYSNECISALWDVLVPFSDYSFSKSHSTSYGIISYWSAYLKCHHPVEWMASVLSRTDNEDDLKAYIGECHRMRIPILPPDINDSDGTWTATDEGIRYGLASIKGIKENAFTAISKKRPYKTLHDFYSRADRKALSGATLGALVRSGALDGLCPHRSDHALVYETLSDRALSDRAAKRKGQLGLLSAKYSVPDSGSRDVTLRQQWERELLGVALTVEPVQLTATRWLTESEFYFISEVVSKNPGRQQLSLKLGFATIPVGSVNWSEKLRRQIESIGGVKVA